MFRQYYNLVLMALWLVIAVVLLAPGWVLPERVAGRIGGPQAFLAGLLALMFVVYNGVRWWSYRMLYRARDRARTALPLEVRHVDETGEKYTPNPELDFLKVPDADKPPEPPTNGDEKP